MSYISVFILIVICVLCIYSGGKKINDSKAEEDNEIKNQKIFSAIGLLFFGGIGLIALLYIIFFL
jgi:hypothetical protein